VIEFAAVADGIYVALTQPLDVNVSLVIGDDTALVIDTLSTGAQAEALLAAIRPLTTLPLTVLNTHYHFDHTFGNAVVAAGGRPIWAHPNAAAELRDNAIDLQRHCAAAYRDSDPEFAAGIAAAKIQPPDHLVRATERLDLGGRHVTIVYHGRGHTDGDLVAAVDEADVIFAGDLIEVSGPPCFGDDSYPLDWPQAVSALLAPASPSTVIVPGHGDRVDADFAARQHDQLAAFAWLIREGHADGASVDAVASRAPWPDDSCREGVKRGYAFLDDPLHP
jgi:glyoxylase-like metal-dependent hydrolase (beta-lactamase superfamily II)